MEIDLQNETKENNIYSDKATVSFTQKFRDNRE